EGVRKHTGIPVSVGFGKTKTLAKVANHYAKRSTRPGVNGVLDLTPKNYQDIALHRLPVADVWGVGHRYAAMLEKSGIQTALDLRDADDEWVRERMTVVGVRTVQELRGVQGMPIAATSPAKKLITRSRTFGTSTDSYQELKAALAFFTARAAEKLRRQKLVAGTLNVLITTDRFRDDPQYSGSITLSAAPKTDSTIELTALAMKGLERIFRAGFKIRKAGVTLGSLELAEKVSRRLWDDGRYEDHRRLMQAMDSINRRFGRDTVRCGLYP